MTIDHKNDDCPVCNQDDCPDFKKIHFSFFFSDWLLQYLGQFLLSDLFALGSTHSRLVK